MTIICPPPQDPLGRFLFPSRLLFFDYSVATTRWRLIYRIGRRTVSCWHAPFFGDGSPFYLSFWPGSEVFYRACQIRSFSFPFFLSLLVFPPASRARFRDDGQFFSAPCARDFLRSDLKTSEFPSSHFEFFPNSLLPRSKPISNGSTYPPAIQADFIFLLFSLKKNGFGIFARAAVGKTFPISAGCCRVFAAWVALSAPPSMTIPTPLNIWGPTLLWRPAPLSIVVLFVLLSRTGRCSSASVSPNNDWWQQF